MSALADPLAIAADILDPPDWQAEGRAPLKAHQLPPEGFPSEEKSLWILEAGRGSGKTEACARYFTKWMRQHPGARGRIIAPTYDDAVESCVRGPSGLLDVDPDVRFIVRPGGSKAIWPNGSEALVLGTYSPKDVERLRAGGNRDIDWWEEMAANPQLGLDQDEQGAWSQAALGLRRGVMPHSIASTTPRSTKAYRERRDDDGTVITKASMFDNIEHLAKSFIERMRKKYEGTRLGRQELYGELLTDVIGALWTRERIEESRVAEDMVPDLALVVTAVDPAATSKEDSDDTGIVTVGLGTNGEAYVLGDDTQHDEPAVWGAEAIATMRRYEGDYIVGEVNNGGDMVEYVIKSIDSRVGFKSVRASRGKAVRAQPVAALWGKPKDKYGAARAPEVHIVGSLPALEDQLVTWVPGEEDSPDRLDAMVWGVTELMLAEQEDDDVYVHDQPVRIGADI